MENKITQKVEIVSAETDKSVEPIEASDKPEIEAEVEAKRQNKVSIKNPVSLHILGITSAGLQKGLLELGIKKYKASQIWDWVYRKGVLEPTEMTNLSKSEQEVIAKELSFAPLEISKEQKSSDGTIKWLFKLSDGNEIETVFIPEGDRGTLCVSSQIGCVLNCKFCHTGTQKLARNLTADEIVAQLYMAKNQLGEWELDKNEKRIISNIVFMGMGEPLYNWDNVETACRIMMDAKGLAMGTRKITISTSGMVKNIPLIAELGVNIAISLHAPNDEIRTKIMPINKKWGVAELMKTVRALPLKERRRITWEYIMLKGINDKPEHAKELVKIIEGIPSFVNLIPFNPWPGVKYECSDEQTIKEFSYVIINSGVAANIRRARGEDILAACGQLKAQGGNTLTWL